MLQPATGFHVAPADPSSPRVHSIAVLVPIVFTPLVVVARALARAALVVDHVHICHRVAVVAQRPAPVAVLGRTCAISFTRHHGAFQSRIHCFGAQGALPGSGCQSKNPSMPLTAMKSHGLVSARTSP